jgi:amino acid permease
MPLLFLPAKETVEVLFLKGGRQMTKKENILCTFVLVFISYIFAIFVPSIGSAMELAGCTTNPMVRL